jgi:hypothetical protein
LQAGVTIGLTVVGIYAYTIRAVHQETFLDDREVPMAPVRAPVGSRT